MKKPSRGMVIDLNLVHSEETSTLLQRLYDNYLLEGMKMPYTMADFRRDYVKEHLKDLTAEEVREGLPSEYLKVFSSEERLKGMPPEERRKGLSPEEREALFKLLASQQQNRPTDDSKRE